jgi:hypothetical protein
MLTLYLTPGILCGQCKDGTGVSVLLNNCVSCSDGFLALIIVLGKHEAINITMRYLSYVALVVILISAVLIIVTLIDKPLPDWMIPFLFYIQV